MVKLLCLYSKSLSKTSFYVVDKKNKVWDVILTPDCLTKFEKDYKIGSSYDCLIEHDQAYIDGDSIVLEDFIVMMEVNFNSNFEKNDVVNSLLF